MKALLSKLLESKKFASNDLRLLAITRLNSLQLSGFIELRKYRPFKPSLPRFEGGESTQIKRALSTLCGSKTACFTEVKNTPCMLPGMEALYEFSAIRIFKNKASLSKELASLKKTGILGDFQYFLHTPKQHEHAH